MSKYENEKYIKGGNLNPFWILEQQYKYEDKENSAEININIAINNNIKFHDNNYFTKALNSNLLFSREDIEWYTKFNRYGYLDPFNNRTANREYLFFTKPDLRIFDNIPIISCYTM